MNEAGMFIPFKRLIFMLCALAVLTVLTPAARPATPSLGLFQDHQDVGTVLHSGSVEYDPAQQTYTIGGSGADMWYGEDDFQFLWTKVSGDVSLTADIAFVGSTGNNHRKAVLMIRQNLDVNSPAVDVARHGDGLTALQFRDAAGANIQEVRFDVSAPRTVRIEKRGDSFYAFVSGGDGKLQDTGPSTKLVLTDPFYIGLGVCSHDKDVVEKAVFSNVKLVSLPPTTGKPIQ
jgi:TolB protein